MRRIPTPHENDNLFPDRCPASLVCVPAMGAGAGDADAMQGARTRFRRGVRLYSEGSFEAALAEFNKAYQLSFNYRLLYNIAQTQFDLHDYVGTQRSLEHYMSKGGGEITEERRAQVAEPNRKLEERIGQVVVTCSLDGAEIRIDDARSKMTSYTLATDILAATTLLSAGVAVYYLFADSDESEAPRASGAKRSVGLAPTVGALCSTASGEPQRHPTRTTRREQ